MEKEVLVSFIEEYLEGNGWSGEKIGDEVWYTKGYSQASADNKKFCDIDKVYSILQKNLSCSERREFHFDSIINPKGDTDYIIAGIQMIAFLNDLEKKERNSFFSFQPVIRTVPSDKVGVPGFLPCFVNVCMIETKATIEDFVNGFETWITILSKCSIHISSIRIKIKRHTNAYDGIGLKVCVFDEEIGQCNVYQIDSFEGFVLDYGFGLERICWAVNGFSNFDSIGQKYENFGLNVTDFSRQLSLIVLMMKSGIKPNSSKYGLRLRNLFEIYANKYSMWNYIDSIQYYYHYWGRFIDNEISVDDILNSFSKEMSYQKKKIIASNAKTPLPKKNNLTEDALVLHYLQGHMYTNE